MISFVGSRGVTHRGREKVGRHVAPVVHPPRGCRRVLVVLHHRHQFDSGHTKFNQVIDARSQAAGRFEAALRETDIRAPRCGSEVGNLRRVVLDVQLVDDQIFRIDFDMARRRIGRMVVHHAFAAASIDRLTGIDEGR